MTNFIDPHYVDVCRDEGDMDEVDDVPGKSRRGKILNCMRSLTSIIMINSTFRQ